MNNPSVLVAVVPSDGDQPIEVKRIDRTLTAFQATIGGGFIEEFGGDGWAGYRDEDGWTNRQPLNHRAVGMAQFAGPTHHGKLFGDVVFFGSADEDGEETDLPQWFISVLEASYPDTKGI